jgi:uncharacterized protein
MRNKKRQVTSRAAMEAVLQEARLLHLGMCDQEHHEALPYVLPLNFGYADGCIYIHSSREGKKIDILRRNPRVCFAAEVDVALRPPKAKPDPDAPGDESASACAFGMRYRSVVGFGRAVILEYPDAVRQGLDVIMAHYSEGRYDYLENVLGKTAVIRIDVESMTGKQDLRE